MLKVINFFVGIAVATGSALLNPAIAGATFIANLGAEMLGASSEFIGDGTQGFIGKIVETIKRRKELKKIKLFIERNFTDNDNNFKKILRELTNSKEIDYSKFSKKKIAKLEKKENKQNAKLIINLSLEVLFNIDFESFLKEKSSTFARLKLAEPEIANNFVSLIELAVEIYTKDMFYASDNEDMKLAATVIVKSIKEYMHFGNEGLEDRIINKLLSFVAVQNGGSFTLQEIALSRYAPKYILNVCPECGYDGDRIYTDEKRNITHCAACGKSYSIIKYCEPELWKEINKKTGEILGDIGRIDEKLTGFMSNNNERLDGFKNLLWDLKNGSERSSNQLLYGLSQVVTKEYLEKNLDIQNVKLAELVNNAFIEFGKQIGAFKLVQEDSSFQMTQRETVDIIIKNINEENQKYNSFLSQRLNSLDNQISSLYDYAKAQFSSLGIKSDLVLEYVKKLCTKEYFESRTNALGTDLKKAITDETQKGFQYMTALNADGIAQIMSAIDEIKQNCEKGGHSEVDLASSLEKIISDENQQLSGKINTLQNLVENGNRESRSAFRKIIDSQEEIKTIFLSKIGLNMGHQEVERMYRGKIPDKYIINDGFDGEFTCLYCGATAEHKVNSEQVCKCVACGMMYFKVKPEFINKVVKECGFSIDNKYLPTKENTTKWIEKHTATVVDNELCAPIDFIKDKIMFIPPRYCEEDTKLILYKDEKNGWYRSIETIIVPREVISIDTTVFNETIALKKVVFRNKLISLNRKKDSEGNPQDNIFNDILKNKNIYYKNN